MRKWLKIDVNDFFLIGLCLRIPFVIFSLNSFAMSGGVYSFMDPILRMA